MSLLPYWPVADEINACIKHEAEGAHDAVLLAVHRPSPLSYKLISSGEKFEASEEELFNYLITEDVPSGAHVVPITGSSGVGKSHMVRILNARLRSVNEDGRYVVIRIPKSASLRRVVELILEKLPEDEYAQVRAEFAKALTEDLDVDTAVIRFQRELDIALGQLAKELETRVRGNPRDSALKEQLGHALNIPKFMGDPVLVDHFRGKVFPRFVRRAIAGQHKVETEELVTDFVPDDLVLPESIDISKSASPTNAYYTRNLLGRDGGGLRAAAHLLNENMVVDQAIRQLFNLHQSLGGMTLQDVILEIRSRLLGQGRELVIFVEDFKALTGIQDILLKVLIQEGVRDGVQELATMRSVIAVTDGYLDTEDTIATRAKREWKVESELSSPEEVLSRTRALVAAYLNAARWGFKELVRHFETDEERGSQRAWIGAYVDPDGSGDSLILAAFGYEEGIPLFPYTAQAIEQLAKAALTRNNALVFTPRFIIDNVLRSLLLPGRPAFENGQFPPPSINAPVSTAEVAQWLASLPVSADLRERYRRVVSIWGNAPRTAVEVGYIPKEVFDAFNLERPLIEFQKEPKPEAEAEPVQAQPQPAPQPKPEDDSLKVALEKWVQGERMPQNVANKIRKSVAAALSDRIDWSAERCTKVLIKPSHISIPNAGGEAGLSANAIKIAEDHSDQSGQVRSELAAVTRFYHLDAGRRSYEDSDNDMVLIGNLADRLMAQAVSIVRAATNQKLGAAARLLHTNSQMLGLAARGKTPGSLALLLFGEITVPPVVPTGASAAFVEWRALQEQALTTRPELIQLVASFCGSFQGKGSTPYAIDMVRVADSLQAESGAHGANVLELNDELRSTLAAMGEARVITLARRAQQEAISIRNRLIAEFGENFDKQEIGEELKGLADQLGANGAWPPDIGMGTAAFKNRCDDFRLVAIGASLDTLANAGDESADQGSPQMLSRIGRLDVNPLIFAAGFAEGARKVVHAAEKHASTLESQFEGVDPQAQAAEIQDMLRVLLDNLESFSAAGEAP
ncbi:MAG: hypothetical protein K2X35_15450 [Bryobacteraceae bacterium]|nr:hypothetical protein [Bryobacteraceae bacterium]